MLNVSVYAKDSPDSPFTIRVTIWYPVFLLPYMVKGNGVGVGS